MYVNVAAIIRTAAMTLILCSALLASSLSSAALLITPARSVNWSEYLGVNAHLLWFKPGDYQQQIRQLKQLGIKWVRIDLHWDVLEPERGRFRWDLMDPLVAKLQQEGIHSLFYLVGSAPFATSAPLNAPYQDQFPPKDPKAFAQSLEALVDRYPSVDAWQIWNEPNIPSFWRPGEDPEAFYQLLLASSERIVQRHPQTTLLMGGMAYYSQMPVRGGLMLESLYQKNAAALNLVAAYHPYSHYPETDEPGRDDFWWRSRQINRSLRAAGAPQIWATEWGWSSYSGNTEYQALIGEKGQADYTLRRLALMSALDFDRIFLFALSDLDSRATPRDRAYGLLDITAQPKPVYRALQNFLQITGEKLTPASAPTVTALPENSYLIAWQREDGKQLLLFWGESGNSLQLAYVNEGTLHDPIENSQRKIHDLSGVSLPLKPGLQMFVW